MVLADELIGRTIGGYRIGRLLGQGATGWVFAAQQIRLDRTVALKVLDPVLARNADAARRFDEEGRNAARLDHEALIDIYEAGEVDGLHFLAMRYVHGPTLDVVLRANQVMPTADLLAVLRRIAAGLDHAHGRDVIHRDVKPSNIMLEDGDPARAWLGDFGIALSARAAGIYTIGAVGTVSYMSPEQFTSAEIGPAADQYALGCVVFRVLTGHCPYDGDDHIAVLLGHARNPIPSTGLPQVDLVLRRALAKDAADRFGSVRTFVEALAGALGPPPPARVDRPDATQRMYVVPPVPPVRTPPARPQRPGFPPNRP